LRGMQLKLRGRDEKPPPLLSKECADQRPGFAPRGPRSCSPSRFLSCVHGSKFIVLLDS
jgi:hypothetical protein